jgi:hypothetical protein
LMFVRSEQFVRECDEFIRNAMDEYAETKSDRSALRTLMTSLELEREDPDISVWRQLEARLGFDPDDAPDRTMETLAGFAAEYGQAAIDEAATAMPGEGSGDTLRREIEAANDARVECDFSAAVGALAPFLGSFGNQANGRKQAPDLALQETRRGGPEHSKTFELPHETLWLPPWELAEARAESLRITLGVKAGPLRNAALSEVLGTSATSFRTSAAPFDLALPYSLRLAVNDNMRNRVVVRSRWPHDRRFEIARALGDALWAEDGRIGPIAGSKTARQKFQRAFAQSLLCPYPDLIAYIGSDQPTEEDISAAARHFHVSERLVRTVLVNKRVMPRGRLEHPLYQDERSERLDELIEAR